QDLRCRAVPGAGRQILADVGPRLAAIGRTKELRGLLVRSCEQRLSFGIAEVDAHRIVVRRVAELLEGLTIVGGLVDATAIVNPRLPESAWMSRIVDDG